MFIYMYIYIYIYIRNVCEGMRTSENESVGGCSVSVTERHVHGCENISVVYSYVHTHLK